MTTEELASALRTNFEGKPWHGSALRVIVGAVTAERAYERPAGDVRSIAELLAHTIAWIEIVDERLDGREVEVSEDRDFPSVDGVAWPDLVDRLDRAYNSLAHHLATMQDGHWQKVVAGKTHTMEYMVNGLLHHNTYHGAQIAILNRVLSGGR